MRNKKLRSMAMMPKFRILSIFFFFSSLLDFGCVGLVIMTIFYFSSMHMLFLR